MYIIPIFRQPGQSISASSLANHVGHVSASLHSSNNTSHHLLNPMSAADNASSLGRNIPAASMAGGVLVAGGGGAGGLLGPGTSF